MLGRGSSREDSWAAENNISFQANSHGSVVQKLTPNTLHSLSGGRSSLKIMVQHYARSTMEIKKKSQTEGRGEPTFILGYLRSVHSVFDYLAELACMAYWG
jgi:hypothetical protein